MRSNMPDLLPQTPSNAGMAGPGNRGMSQHESGGGLGSPHPSQQELQVCITATLTSAVLYLVLGFNSSFAVIK